MNPQRPTESCPVCDYPITPGTSGVTCPECGADTSISPLYNTKLLYPRGFVGGIAVITALFILVAASIAALLVSPDPFAPVAIRSTYLGWWLAMPCVITAFICYWLCRKPDHPTASMLALFGITCWIFTAVGITLHYSRDNVELGLGLSAFAPVATLCMFLMPASVALQLRHSVANVSAVVSAMVACSGMAIYVATLTVLYFDYTTGLNLYLGGRNADWAKIGTKGGLLVFIAGGTSLLCVCATLLSRGYRWATKPPSY